MSEYIAEVVQNQYGEATILKEKLTRCKDCKHWSCDDYESFCSELGIFNTDMESYCSYAKRKE